MDDHHKKIIEFISYLIDNGRKDFDYMDYIKETLETNLQNGKMAKFDEVDSVDLVKKLNEFAELLSQIVTKSEEIAVEVDRFHKTDVKRDVILNKLLD